MLQEEIVSHILNSRNKSLKLNLKNWIISVKLNNNKIISGVVKSYKVEPNGGLLTVICGNELIEVLFKEISAIE